MQKQFLSMQPYCIVHSMVDCGPIMGQIKQWRTYLGNFLIDMISNTNTTSYIQSIS